MIPLPSRAAKPWAFTKVEALVMVVAVFVVGLLLVRPTLDKSRFKAQRIQCINNLKNLGLAARIFATDHGDMLPGERFLNSQTNHAMLEAVHYFLSFSNELSTPKIIACPVDAERPPAESWSSLATTNIGYFAGLKTLEADPQAFLFGDRNLTTNGQQVGPGMLSLTSNLHLGVSSKPHPEGINLMLGDGSVQLFSSEALQHALRAQGGGTNLLLMP